MTRLGYLLPFLCALGWGATVTPTPPPRTVVTSVTPLTTATQVATTVDKVKTTVSPSNPAVPTSVTTTVAAIHDQTTKLPPVSAGTTKLTTTIISDSQGAVQPTTSKADTKAVGVTSSEPRLSTIEGNTPNVSSPNDNPTQPTYLAKASTSVLDGTTVVVTSQPSITENATKPATSLPFLKTSEESIAIGVTNYISTVASGLSTLVPSPVTTSKTTVGSISVSTTSLPKETSPKAKPYVTHILENIEVNCTSEYVGSFVKINIKPSRICGENIHEDDAKEILKHICTAVKPGYQPNKDKCHIELGTGIPDQLVIKNAYVQSSLSPNDLYASIKHIKKDSSYLFQYDKEKNEEEDLVSIPLISAIVSLAVALLIIAAIYGCWHQRQTRKREQRLTEELQTMENGYHDNPTLEVMETAPEMQEKKGGPNGELGDSWIVPLDNLTREDLDEEEDTHL